LFSDKVLSFIPLCTWNLSSFMYGGTHPNTYITLGKSLVIDILFMIILTALSYICFKRKEIKNQ
jgi:ABC-type transport system involved in multi-copper enzyme maturation permease subunit